jgi:hypothetical protein
MANVKRTQAKRRGRPPLPRDAVKRAPLSLRTTIQLKRALETRSSESGRSIAQEVENALEGWLAFEEGLGGRRMVVLFRMMAAAAMLIEGELGRGATMTDYQTYAAAEEAWAEIIRSAGPPPDEQALEDLSNLRLLFNEAPPAPQFPELPMPQFPSGFGTFVSPEIQAERETLIREYQQRYARWQAQFAEHQQKIEAGLAKLERYKEIGRQAGLRAISTRLALARALTRAGEADRATSGSTENEPET